MDINFFSNQYFIFAILMILAALPAGFLAGLFGIGGGLISVPVLYYVFGAAGFNDNYLMHIAVGTSFSIIVPTSISSVLTHNKFGAVDFNVVKSFGLFVVIGVVLGALFASTLKTQQLVLFFSVIIYYLNNFSYVLGSTERISLIISILIPIVILSTINCLMLYGVNKK